jgi:CRP/FNR family transcriptional regulator, cyclic AMP receptor protein
LLHRKAPADFILSSLERAGVRVAERRLQAGAVVYTRGEPERYLYFLTEGVLKLYKSYGGHKEAILTLLEEGSVFGEPDPHTGMAHRDSAEAVVCSRVAAVDKPALLRHVRRDPMCTLALLSAYEQWIRRHEQAIVRLAHRPIRPRLASSLLELSDRFGEATEGEVAIGVCLTHRTLAEMTASSRVGVSKEMAHFRREGLVETRGKGQIILLDRARLDEIAQGS